MVFLGSADIDIPADVRPWASPGRERERRERDAAMLVGDSITGVRYYDSDPTIVPWRCDGFDSVAHGVELFTSAGHTFGATWALDREHVGLSFRREALQPRWLSGYSRVCVWDLVTPGGWAGLMKRPIDEVRLRWWEQKPPGEADGCHTASLYAGGCAVHVVLGGATPDRCLEGRDENIAVVFDDAVAQEAQVGPWMPAGWAG